MDWFLYHNGLRHEGVKVKQNEFIFNFFISYLVRNLNEGTK